MALHERIFRAPQRDGSLFTIGDFTVLALLVVVLTIGVQLALDTPEVVRGPDIHLDPAALPYYALLSVGRMLAAYILSLIFSIFYGYIAARSQGAQRWLMPLLDILQSVPILSFLPVVLLSLTAILPEDPAVDLAAVVLIFTSQAWNLTFSFYQSMRTIPTEYREAAAVFRFSRWLRFRQVEMPFAAMGLIWNSVMSWAGGWFFLMAAEIFTLGDRDFRLPGLGAYLHTAASEGDTSALGQAYAEASILTRKELFAQRAKRLPMIQWMTQMLRASSDHALPWKVFYTALLPEFPDQMAERQLDVAISWGRYAELIDYDDGDEYVRLDESGGRVATPA